MHKLMWGGRALLLAAILTANGAQAQSPAPRAVPKTIIFMVPDGLGLTAVTAARIFAGGPDGGPLAFETLAHIGYQRTHSADALVTDSAAAASAWAMGAKFNNGAISCHDADGDRRCDDPQPTILQSARRRGLATGLVVTSQITHATPAAFGAHSFSRDCGLEIARQYLVETQVDVLLGGGVPIDRPPAECDIYQASFAATDPRQYVLELAMAAGYTFVADAAALRQAVAGGTTRLFGLFEENGPGRGKTPEMFRVNPGVAYPRSEPTLAELTRAALEVLARDADGFFLVVEGSQIDWAAHARHLEGEIAEILGFDAAVREVLSWMERNPQRKPHTQLIIVADHETGGLALTGPDGALPQKGDVVRAGWATGDHTAQDTIVWSRGPGTAQLNRALDNTDLYHVMRQYLD
jgi:alkaline phosphatase